MIRVAVGRGRAHRVLRYAFRLLYAPDAALLPTWQPGPTQPNGWGGAMMGR
jgi:hypothetical protein